VHPFESTLVHARRHTRTRVQRRDAVGTWQELALERGRERRRERGDQERERKGGEVLFHSGHSSGRGGSESLHLLV